MPNVTARMDLPQSLDRDEHVDLHGRNVEPWIRALVLLILLGVIAAGLANVFGQRVGEDTVRAEAADVTLEAPSAARGGLIYQVRIRIDAHRELAEPTLVFDPGWYDGLTINTFQPEPVEWLHRDGRNAMVYGPVPSGEKLVVRLHYQVNPTAVGRRTQTLVLEDGGERLALIRHDLTLYP